MLVLSNPRFGERHCIRKNIDNMNLRAVSTLLPVMYHLSCWRSSLVKTVSDSPARIALLRCGSRHLNCYFLLNQPR